MSKTYPAEAPLVRPLPLAAMTGVVVLAFSLVFLSQGRLQDIVATDNPDTLSLNYLHVLLALQPSKHEVRLELARELRILGRFEEATEILNAATDSEDPDALPVQYAALETIWVHANSAYATYREKRQRLAALVGLLVHLRSRPFLPTQVEALAAMSLGADRPDLASEFYERLGTHYPREQVRWLALAGKYALAAANPGRAGVLYDRAVRLSPANTGAEDLAIKAVDSFRAANRGASAMSLAPVYARHFPNHIPLLEKLVALARAQNDLSHALQWNEKLLALLPENDKYMQTEVDISLAKGDLDHALRMLKQQLAKYPNDNRLIERTAQIAEWASQPAVALSHWRNAALLRPDSPAMPRATALARSLGDYDALIALLTVTASRQRLADSELQELLYAFEQRGRRAERQRFLKNYLRLWPVERGANAAWIAALIADHRLDEAVQALHQSANPGPAHTAADVSVRLREAELRLQLNQPREALIALQDIDRQGQAMLANNTVHYWQMVMQAANAVQDTVASEQAATELAHHNVADVGSSELMIERLRSSKRWEEAIANAEHASVQHRQPRLLLLAMDIAAEAKRWRDISRLHQLALNLDSNYFQGIDRFWLLAARAASETGDQANAIAAYERALNLSNDPNTRAMLLWHLIDTKSWSRLSALLPQWSETAKDSEVLWPPYAAGYTGLGQIRLAIPWYERQYRKHPQDVLWRLSFADALDQAARPKDAWKIRKQVFTELHQRLSQLPEQTVNIDYVRSLLSFKERSDGEVLEAKSLGSQISDPKVASAVVAWHLARGDMESAHAWLRNEHLAREKLPAWQRLAVALSSKDSKAVIDILNNESNELVAPDRINALRQLGQSKRALELLQKHLDENS